MLFLAHALQPLPRAKTVVSMARLNQLASMILINLLTLRLLVRSVRPSDVGAFIPLQSEPVQAVDQFFLRIGIIAFAVGVLDAQDELAAGLARQEEIIESGAPAAQMSAAGRRGREPGAGGLGWCGFWYEGPRD